MERDGVRVGLGRRIFNSLPWIVVALLTLTSAELFYEAASYPYGDVGSIVKLIDCIAAAVVLGVAVLFAAFTLLLRGVRWSRRP